MSVAVAIVLTFGVLLVAAILFADHIYRQPAYRY